LSSCGLRLPFSNVHSGYDDFKNEKINYYRYSGKALSLLYHRGGYSIDLDFKQIEAEHSTKNKMVLYLNLVPGRLISDSIFIKINQQIFPLSAQKLIQTPIKGSHTEVKTEVENTKKKDDKNSNDKQSVTTTQTTDSYEYIHTGLFFMLPEKIIDNLKNTDLFALRFYVDDQPYTIEIKKKKLDKIKKVFGVNEEND